MSGNLTTLNSTLVNVSESNYTQIEYIMCYPVCLPYNIPLITGLCILTIITIAGNVSVMLLLKLIVTLAVTDLIIGIIQMLFLIFYLIQDIEPCCLIPMIITDMSIVSTFVFVSVFHLLAIALDRYWSLTDFKYMLDRSVKRIVFMIISCWSASFMLTGTLFPIYSTSQTYFMKQLV